MTSLCWAILFLFIYLVLNYHRASIYVWMLSSILFLSFLTRFNGLTWGVMTCWVLFFLLFIPLSIRTVRRSLISKPILHFYRRMMPTMSRTEREAISAGTVTWEGDLFRGNPSWHKLLSLPKPLLSEEEKAFLDGPVETLCAMIDDWKITHDDADLPPEIWDFLKKEGFFALIIPKQYGGKQFSSYAHTQILTKVGGRSITVSTTISVPNSLGPSELLLHYGTEAQKNYYLPRLAKGEEMPCFALTSQDAGSDAGAMTDHGILCWQEFEGKDTLGIRLNWNKRYITLAPVATVIGLAFKLYDPDYLLGNKEDLGITCALIPRTLPGITIGRRHFPLNTPFMNGPVSGKNVFIPLDWIIGGVEKAGKGWVMLMECLAAGRGISLPATAIAGGKVMSYTAGAYARIRKQFNVPIGRFEGIQAPLARIAAFTYIIDAARSFAAASIDAGEKPAVASAIIKYHTTELGRKIVIDAMDIFGGKGICLGPKNFVGRGYEASPIAITVEGANILTRTLIIFGQGAIRCHPYVLAELEAAKLTDPKKSLNAFDRALFRHFAFTISNIWRSLILGLTSSLIVKVPRGELKRYYQHATRFSSAFALLSDFSMLTYGGYLKRKENISGRLGDILSYLYLLSATLKHYSDQGEPVEDLPIVKFACEFCLSEIQDAFANILKNFAFKSIAIFLHFLIFPLGKRFSKPKDFYNRQIAQLMMAPTESRQRLCEGAFLSSINTNVLADVQDALIKTIAAEPIEKVIRLAKKENQIQGYTFQEIAQSALNMSVITQEEFNIVMQAQEARQKVISVDDFTTEDLARNAVQESKQYLYANVDGSRS